MDRSPDARVVLRGSRARWAGLLAASAVFVLGGILVLAFASGGRVAGVAVIVFFGACSAVAAYQLIVGTQLVLAPDGFTVRSLGRTVTRRWKDVEEFDVFRPSAFMSMVGVTYAGGFKSALPDTFGMKANELASLMNEWRARYSGPPATRA